MESRYALREIQGAIGIDSRKLEDGRRAMFRHTAFHRRARRDYFERRDAMLVLHASFMSVASLGSHACVDLQEAAVIAAESRSALLKAAFPYVEVKNASSPSAAAGISEEEMAKIMENLRRINANNKAKSEDTRNAGGTEQKPDKPEGPGETSAVGQVGPK